MRATTLILQSAVLTAALAAASTWARDLPDFTRLVDANAPAVVNISTVQHGPSHARPNLRNEDLEEFFRRFFPPDEPRPRGPSRPRSLGSGFVIERDGYIVTNNHVVEDADEIIVRFNDRRELTAELVGADPRSDLAVLKVDADDLPTVKLGRSEGLKAGEWVLAIGSPFGFDYSVTAGIVSAKGRSLPTDQNENYVPFIQTDVAINPGNSGGPLFNLKGEVIGINSQIYSNSGGFMGVSFAIPIDIALEVVRQLRETGRVSRGWLGVVIQEVNRDLAESFGLQRPHGALVTRVLEDSPAESAGLKAGDIITRFNGTAIDFSSDLPHVVGRVAAGSEADVRIVREGQEMTLDVVVGELAERDAGDDPQPPPADDVPSRIGLQVEPLSEELAERLDVAGGVRVVESRGPAAEAGINAGDVVTRLNNREVIDVDGFQDLVEDLPAGRSVPVLIIRGETPRFLALRIPE
ncbi:MAG: DegQ family serine endoprotease [Gammaproteobacteria bacterium]|nr:DegQ family serine endoprotease [Gammaproteobacteria bacterium]